MVVEPRSAKDGEFFSGTACTKCEKCGKGQHRVNCKKEKPPKPPEGKAGNMKVFRGECVDCKRCNEGKVRTNCGLAGWTGKQVQDEGLCTPCKDLCMPGSYPALCSTASHFKGPKTTGAIQYEAKTIASKNMLGQSTSKTNDKYPANAKFAEAASGKLVCQRCPAIKCKGDEFPDFLNSCTWGKGATGYKEPTDAEDYGAKKTSPCLKCTKRFEERYLSTASDDSKCITARPCDKDKHVLVGCGFDKSGGAKGPMKLEWPQGPKVEILGVLATFAPLPLPPSTHADPSLQPFSPASTPRSQDWASALRQRSF